MMTYIFRVNITISSVNILLEQGKICFSLHFIYLYLAYSRLEIIIISEGSDKNEPNYIWGNLLY